ncbi:MAG: RNA 2',3'-cyclic phosphodiesterase [Isosphaera sp.]|nr:RNA 2',3'-cyclic phosphodiesterase [Isosphaera sp.]
MPRTRTFIAVDPGPGVRAAAADLQRGLARTGAEVRWVAPEGMHVTLLFLGEVDDRELPAVCRAVAEVAATEPAFTLGVSGVGAFPNARRPKVVWAGVTEGADALRRLHAKLEARLLDLGCYRAEERGYTPHLTLGRVRGEADGFALVPELARHATWDAGRAAVDEVLVFGSVLERDGPVYTVLGRGELAGAG